MTIDKIPECRWCGHAHGDLCPQVKALEFYEDGTTPKRVEFLTPADRPAHEDWKGVKP